MEVTPCIRGWYSHVIWIYGTLRFLRSGIINQISENDYSVENTFKYHGCHLYTRSLIQASLSKRK